jgi:hypothetical protein
MEDIFIKYYLIFFHFYVTYFNSPKDSFVNDVEILIPCRTELL